MVRKLVALKARLTWNGLRADTQRRIGLPVATLLLGYTGYWLATHYWEVARSVPIDSPAFLEISAWGSLFAFAAWITLPVIIFPLDENLDPEQLAALPLSRNQMAFGLCLAALVAPSAIVPFTLLATNAALVPRSLFISIPASVVFLGMLVTGSQLFSSAISAVLKSRRGRDVATLFVAAIGLGSFLVFQMVSGATSELGVGGAAAAHPISSWAWLIPPVAPAAAIVAAGVGDWVTSFGLLAVATMWLLLMGRVFAGLVHWMMITPKQQARAARVSRRRGMTAGPWGVVAVVARKELRFFVRDPRQRLVWTGTVIFVGLAVAAVLAGSSGIFNLRTQAWAPLFAPFLVLFVGLPIALNLFGWERNAATYLFALPPKPRQLILGKNAAVALGLLAETIILGVALSFFAGDWTWTWLVPPLAVSAIGCQLAVGNLTSVLTPLRLPREGTDVFAQSTEQGCLAIVSQTVSFFLIGVLLIPPASAVALTVSFGQNLPAQVTIAVSVVWGLLVYAISLGISGALLRRRFPEMLDWIHVA